jgi:MFS family permease
MNARIILVRVCLTADGTRGTFLSVLRTNRNFRLLYIGQTISQLGDWFNSVAIFALLLDLTGSATAVAWMMIVQFMPVAIVGPMAGVVVDRVDRRRLMIGADLLRGLLMLGLLLVDRREDVWIAYVVMALSVSAQAFFEPARVATIPNITSAEELMPANAVSSATWSAMLAIGASVGGLVTAVAGRNVAFVINAASFFASAYFIGKTRFDSAPRSTPRVEGFLALTGIVDLLEGLRYVRERSHVAALMFVKAGWGLAGGVLLLLTIFGQRVFPVGGSTAAGIGILYGARGIGAALGPIALRWILGQHPATLRRTIAPAFFVIGAFYMALAGAPTLFLAAFCILCAHFGGSILWVFSTVLLQMEVPDRFRGRVFAAELALVTLTSSLSSYWTGYALDRAGWSPRAMAFTLGAMFLLPGALWLVMLSRWRSDDASLEPPASTMSGEEEVLQGRIG